MKDRPMIALTRPGLLAPRLTESAFRDIGRLLEGREFSSIEEMNRFLQNAITKGRPPRALPTGPRDRARDLAWKAWEAKGKERLRLAREALNLWPACPDAINLLATEGTDDAAEALALFERVLAEPPPEDDLPLRAYVRSVVGRARTLQDMGRLEEAAAGYRSALELDPMDRIGARFLLMPLLIRLDRDDEAEELIAAEDARTEESDEVDKPQKSGAPHETELREEAADIAYARALLAFRSNSRAEVKTRALLDAFNSNWAAAAYLLGDKPLPDRLPESIAFGDDSEAIVTAWLARTAWEATPGALEWLRLVRDEFLHLAEERMAAEKAELRQVTGVTEDEDAMLLLVHYQLSAEIKEAESPELPEAFAALRAAGFSDVEAREALIRLRFADPHDPEEDRSLFTTDVHRVWLQTVARARPHALTAWFRHGAALPGRNDLCFCGSGRKFKRCCGFEGWNLPRVEPIRQASRG